MKYTIIKRFRDLVSNQVFNPGDEIEIADPKRYNELKESLCIEPKEQPVEPKKRGRKKKNG